MRLITEMRSRSKRFLISKEVAHSSDTLCVSKARAHPGACATSAEVQRCVRPCGQLRTKKQRAKEKRRLARTYRSISPCEIYNEEDTAFGGERCEHCLKLGDIEHREESPGTQSDVCCGVPNADAASDMRERFQ